MSGFLIGLITFAVIFFSFGTYCLASDKSGGKGMCGSDNTVATIFLVTGPVLAIIAAAY